MEEIWIGITSFVVLLLFVAQIIGAIKLYKGSIFWVGRNLMTLYWKKKKSWPVELNYSGRIPIATYHAGPQTIEIEVEDVWLKLRDKHPKTKIDKFGITLSSNGYSWEAHEFIPVSSYRHYFRLTGIKLGELEVGGGYYLFNFSTTASDYLRDWCNGKIEATMYGIVWLETGRFRCESNAFLVNPLI